MVTCTQKFQSSSSRYHWKHELEFCHTTVVSCLTQITIYRQAHRPLARYVKLRVAHAPGMPGTFSLPLTSKVTTWLRHTRAVMHVGIANPRWRGKRSRHSRRMHNPQFYVSGNRPEADSGASLFIEISQTNTVWSSLLNDFWPSNEQHDVW